MVHDVGMGLTQSKGVEMTVDEMWDAPDSNRIAGQCVGCMSRAVPCDCERVEPWDGMDGEPVGPSASARLSDWSA